MAKPGKHKARYDRYKNSGHKEDNKIRREKRHKKRMERFEERKKLGKCYTYSKEKSQQKIKGLKNTCSSLVEFNAKKAKLFRSNVGSNRGCHTMVAKETSVYKKMDNLLKERIELEKAKTRAARLKGNKS